MHDQRTHPGTLAEQWRAIERTRLTGAVLVALGVAGLLGGLWLLTTTASGPLVGLVLAAVLLALGIRYRLDARRRLVAFAALVAPRAEPAAPAPDEAVSAEAL